MSHVYHTPEELNLTAELILKKNIDVNLTAKERAALDQQDMPVQSPELRIKNMQEVAIGYSEAQVKAEAMRCLQCKNAPCIKGCPVNINIPAFIKAAGEGNYTESLKIIKQDSLLPAICGRVCPQETQCMELCTVGKMLKDPMKSVAIGRIERYVADYEFEHNLLPKTDVAPPTGKKIAVVGSGPAGLSAAYETCKAGHDVTVFEAFHKPGGVTIYGIPEFRLPKKIVEREIDTLISMGVTFKTNFLVGRTRKMLDLMEKDGFDAVFLGTGAGLPNFMHIEGENLVGVFSANEFLTRSNLMKAYDRENAATPIYRSKHVAVFGGGNVAMDAARTAIRLGAEKVFIVYRRSADEMPARAEEVAHAIEEGIKVIDLATPLRITGNAEGRVTGIECIRNAPGEVDASGRKSFDPVKGSEFTIPADTCIIAIGNSSNPLISMTTLDLKVNKRGNIIADENGQTSISNVYAGGDIVLGAATVILAMGEGKKAGQAINQALKSK